MKQPIQDALDASNLRLTKDASGEVVSTPLDIVPTKERTMNAYARVMRIMEGDRRSSYEETLKNSACPDLARDYVQLFAWVYIDRHKLAPVKGRDPNPFRGLSDVDCARLLERMIEDICDRSTGRLGPWTNGISVTASARR